MPITFVSMSFSGKTRRVVCRILTTTACNARCAYCYEKGALILRMEDETAEQAARFLALRAREAEAPVLLEWFGGEPTVHLSPADRICADLAEAGVDFRSSIVTNGLLADRCLEAGRNRLWNLKSAQITLDGPARFHESVKGFAPGSFDRILQNVQALTDAGIRVKLRLNLGENREELCALIDLLAELFSGNALLFPYVSPVYSAQREYGREAMESVLWLSDRLIAAGLSTKERLYSLRERKGRCFMMEPFGFTMAPDGRLYNCSHVMTEEQCVGSIFRYDPLHPARQAFLYPAADPACAACSAFSICKGGCRIGELGLAPMPQCHPYKNVLEELGNRHVQA